METPSVHCKLHSHSSQDAGAPSSRAPAIAKHLMLARHTLSFMRLHQYAPRILSPKTPSKRHQKARYHPTQIRLVYK